MNSLYIYAIVLVYFFQGTQLLYPLIAHIYYNKKIMNGHSAKKLYAPYNLTNVWLRILVVCFLIGLLFVVYGFYSLEGIVILTISIVSTRIFQEAGEGRI